MKKILLLALFLLICSYSYANVTWTKTWSNQDDLVNDFGGDDLEDIQDDVDSQCASSSSSLTFTGENTFQGAGTFTGSTSFTSTNTFSGTVNFSGGLGIEQSTISLGSFTRDTTAVSGTQAVTGIGFKPKGVIFFSTQTSSVTSETSWGVDDGTTAGSVGNQGTVVADTYSYYSSSIAIIEGAAAYYTGLISSFDSDGFTVTWTRTGAPSGTVTIYYIAFLL